MGPVRVERRVFVAASDGTRLALTTYLPAGEGPFPAVLESVPYRKDDDCYGRDLVTFRYLAEHGIAGVRLDIRGTGASDGVLTDEYLEGEQSDNVDVIRWAAAQDWCNGRVGMWGISWGGFSALQTAMLRPPELGAICAVHATHDRFACDVHYVGGSLHLAEQLEWPVQMVSTNGLPPDPDIVGNRWYDMWMERLEATPQWLPTWLSHQERDAYWLHGSPATDYAAIACPTLLLGGWLDGYVDGMVALAEHLEAPTRLVVGPWGHYRPDGGVPGPTYDHLDLMARWFRHHLAGEDNDVMDLPAATIYVREMPPYDDDEVAGSWRAEQMWPPADGSVEVVPLIGLHPTTWQGPQWIGSHAPAWDRGGRPSVDSADDDAHAMTFETAVYERPLEILGSPSVDLVVTCDRPVALVAARLLLVAPDGASHLICRGNRNLAFRDGLDAPSPVPVGEPVAVSFELMAASAVVPAGWRLRLALAGADFPLVLPPGERFSLTVDAERSSLRLPTVPPRAPGRRADVAAGSPQAYPAMMIESGSETTVERVDGQSVMRRHTEAVEQQDERGNLTYGIRQWFECSVADEDPATARGRSEVVSWLSRPGWSVRSTGSVDLAATPSTLELSIRLVADHDGATVWDRTWRHSVPRRWV
jgi:uncharacterized protein